MRLEGEEEETEIRDDWGKESVEGQLKWSHPRELLY